MTEQDRVQRMTKYVQDELNKGRNILDILKEKNVKYYYNLGARSSSGAEANKQFKPLADFIDQEYKKYINRPDVIKQRYLAQPDGIPLSVVNEMIKKRGGTPLPVTVLTQQKGLGSDERAKRAK